MKRNSVVFSLVLLPCLGFTNSSIEFSLSNYKIDFFEEDKTGFILDSEKSLDSYEINGYAFSYEYILGYVDEYKHKVVFENRYNNSKSNYDGHLQNLTTGALTPYKSTTDNIYLNTSARYEIFTQTGKNSVGLFGSLGYWMWDRDLLSPYGYLEEYRIPYFEIGLNGIWYDGAFFTGFEISKLFSYNPTATAHLNGGLEFDLKNVEGYKASIPFGYDINENLSCYVNYTYEKWNWDQSNVVGGFVIPKSESVTSFVDFGIKYKF